MAYVVAVDYMKCCCCFTYRQGVITIAVLTLLESIADITYGSLVVETILCSYSGYPHYDWHCFTNSNWYGGTSIFQGTLSFLMAIVLLIGVLKRVPNLLVPYIYVMFVNALGYLVVGIVVLSVEFDELDEFYCIWFICWSLIVVFFVSVVRKYRKLLLQQTSPGNVSNPYPHAILYGNLAQHGHMAAGFPVGGQPLATHLPPGTYMPPAAHQPSAACQQQGIYLPARTYLPHGMYFPPGTVPVCEGNLLPVHQNPGAPVLVSPTNASGIQHSQAAQQLPGGCVPVYVNYPQQPGGNAPVHLNYPQHPGQQPRAGGSSSLAYSPDFRGYQQMPQSNPNTESVNDDPPPYPGNDIGSPASKNAMRQ